MRTSTGWEYLGYMQRHTVGIGISAEHPIAITIATAIPIPIPIAMPTIKVMSTFK